MSAQHLGCDAFFAAQLGRGRGGNHPELDDHGTVVRGVRHYDPFVVGPLYQREGQEWWHVLHNFPLVGSRVWRFRWSCVCVCQRRECIDEYNWILQLVERFVE